MPVAPVETSTAETAEPVTEPAEPAAQPAETAQPEAAAPVAPVKTPTPEAAEPVTAPAEPAVQPAETAQPETAVPVAPVETLTPEAAEPVTAPAEPAVQPAETAQPEIAPAWPEPIPVQDGLAQADPFRQPASSIPVEQVVSDPYEPVFGLMDDAPLPEDFVVEPVIPLPEEGAQPAGDLPEPVETLRTDPVPSHPVEADDFTKTHEFETIDFSDADGQLPLDGGGEEPATFDFDRAFPGLSQPEQPQPDSALPEPAMPEPEHPGDEPEQLPAFDSFETPEDEPLQIPFSGFTQPETDLPFAELPPSVDGAAVESPEQPAAEEPAFAGFVPEADGEIPVVFTGFDDPALAENFVDFTGITGAFDDAAEQEPQPEPAPDAQPVPEQPADSDFLPFEPEPAPAFENPEDWAGVLDMPEAPDVLGEAPTQIFDPFSLTAPAEPDVAEPDGAAVPEQPAVPEAEQPAESRPQEEALPEPAAPDAQPEEPAFAPFGGQDAQEPGFAGFAQLDNFEDEDSFDFSSFADFSAGLEAEQPAPAEAEPEAAPAQLEETPDAPQQADRADETVELNGFDALSAEEPAEEPEFDGFGTFDSLVEQDAQPEEQPSLNSNLFGTAFLPPVSDIFEIADNLGQAVLAKSYNEAFTDNNLLPEGDQVVLSVNGITSEYYVSDRGAAPYAMFAGLSFTLREGAVLALVADMQLAAYALSRAVSESYDAGETGVTLSDSPQGEPREILYIGSDALVPEEMTCLQFLLYTLSGIKGEPAHEREERIRATLSQVGLAEFENDPVAELSRNKRILLLVLSAALNPKIGCVIVNDNAFNIEGVEENIAKRVFVLLSAANKCAILSCCSRYLMETVANRVLVIRRGAVAFDGTYRQLIDSNCLGIMSFTTPRAKETVAAVSKQFPNVSALSKGNLVYLVRKDGGEIDIEQLLKTAMAYDAEYNSVVIDDKTFDIALKEVLSL